jgi:hypothetical protein
MSDPIASVLLADPCDSVFTLDWSALQSAYPTTLGQVFAAGQYRRPRLALRPAGVEVVERDRDDDASLTSVELYGVFSASAATSPAW